MVAGNYDDPVYAIKREVFVPAPAAGAAGTTKFALFSAAVVSRAQAVVKTAGTSATSGSYIQVLNGTTTLGTLLTGSATAGTLITATLSGTVPAASQCQILQGTDATGVVYGVTVEYQDA
jgi:hypothetical protein